MSKSRLKAAIDVVNKRYAAGLNDDDQVKRMIQIAKATKGWHFIPRYDDYELGTDQEYFNHIAKKYGYWSNEIQQVNEILKVKGGANGYQYMESINNKWKEENKVS